jgi:hypothetical protein
MKTILGAICLSCLFPGLSAFASEDIAPIGKHYPVFRLEKSENAQNVMVTYVKLNEACQITEDSEKALYGFYWLMNRENYKAVHPLIRRGIRKRLELVSISEDRRNMVLRLNNLKEFQQKVKSAEIEIHTKKAGRDCKLDGILAIDGDRIKLEKVYSETTTTFIPPFRKLKALTVTGSTLVGEHKVSRRYSTR